ncbi:RNase H [Lentibacillus persicus]|uniref:RNase H n=1 Tax=Lentibacillus persicus TaxID=640948 RepID=A0A1I1S4I7_9BACI|nr:RNase H family protein [Lentibacillus persicus]SFD41455.1 RNase H [Lentibacillus persicus]
MRQKNSKKSAPTLPDFWGRSKELIKQEHKDWIYDQYFNWDVITIYCDASVNRQNKMAAGFCYVYKGTVTKKYHLINKTSDCSMPVFAEVIAIISALKKFPQNVRGNYSIVLIYSDLDYIDNILTQRTSFKNSCLKIAQKELIDTFEQTSRQHPNTKIAISPLTRNQKKHNPFLKAAHNAARELIT